MQSLQIPMTEYLDKCSYFNVAWKQKVSMYINKQRMLRVQLKTICCNTFTYAHV